VISGQPPPLSEVTITDPTAADLVTIRRYVQRAAVAVGLDRIRSDRFALASSEIVANAIEHGHPPRTAVVHTRSDRIIVAAAAGGSGSPGNGRTGSRSALT
jgi:anti-sigma regulatory factor (Ser/Thr protein kinase)